MTIAGVGNSYRNNGYADAHLAKDDTESIKSRKYMDRIEKGEQINLFQECGDGVTIEVSAEAMEEFYKKMEELKTDGSDIHILSDEEKAKLLQESLKPATRLHRIIGNVETNEKLEKSLQGAHMNTIEAAYSIIENNFLPHNVGELSEKERLALIAVGIEEAKYLAEKMDADKAGLFMDAMNTIAKYGANGEMDSQGNVAYDIRWGKVIGMSGDYKSEGAILPNSSAKEKKEFADWQKKINQTKIESDYTNTDKSDIHSFINDILEQNKVLEKDYLLKNLQHFEAIIADDAVVYPGKWM
ncbi:MAG: hypothetical protein K2P65_06330 [Lachnospiraceae bacterium]|nr:hypothetical protein [Lachnospiraceae bacterium]